MKYEVSTFWSYVKPDDWATCDLCCTTQPIAAFDLGRIGEHVLHHCKDYGFCERARTARLKRERAK